VLVTWPIPVGREPVGSRERVVADSRATGGAAIGAAVELAASEEGAHVAWRPQ